MMGICVCPCKDGKSGISSANDVYFNQGISFVEVSTTSSKMMIPIKDTKTFEATTIKVKSRDNVSVAINIRRLKNIGAPRIIVLTLNSVLIL